MTSALALAISVPCAGLGATAIHAADLSSYRGLQFGMNLGTAAKQTGTSLSDVRTVRQRPALIQEMDWQPHSLAADAAKADPVKGGLLSFLNGELYRMMIITYDRHKVEGMTAEDMIEGISAAYGTATRPGGEIAYHPLYDEVAPVVARWEDSQYEFNLIQTRDQPSFALILYSKRLDALAQAAITEAIRLDAQEAPQREVEKQKKLDQEEQLVLEKARTVNKPNFRP